MPGAPARPATRGSTAPCANAVVRLVGRPVRASTRPSAVVASPSRGFGLRRVWRASAARSVRLRLGVRAARGSAARRARRCERDVARVAAQRLAPVRLRRPGRVPVLLQVHAVTYELVDGRRRRAGAAGSVRAPAASPSASGRSGVASVTSSAPPCSHASRQPSSGAVRRRERDAGAAHGRPGATSADRLARRPGRRRRPAPQDAAVAHGRGHRSADVRRPPARRRRRTAASRLACVRRAGPLDRVPVLAERLRLARGEEREVGLVVGEDAGHQLDVGPVVVGEVARPTPGRTRASPQVHCFLPGRDVVVGPVHEARPARVVVARRRSRPRVPSAHVRGRHGDVAVPVEPVAVRCSPLAGGPGSRRRSRAGRRAGTP